MKVADYSPLVQYTTSRVAAENLIMQLHRVDDIEACPIHKAMQSVGVGYNPGNTRPQWAMQP